MAGLLLKELKVRGLVKRTLIITPASLSFQWQREMKEKFREQFEIIRGDVLRANYGMNPWQERNQVVTSISWVSRIDDAQGARSICPYCGVGCGQLIYHKDGKLVSIEGDPESPISQGNLCPKGAASYQLLTHSRRETKM